MKAGGKPPAFFEMSGEIHPSLRRSSNDHILAVALLISFVVHALALLIAHKSPPIAAGVPLQATLLGPPAAPAAPAAEATPAKESVAPPKREPLPVPMERTYEKVSPTVGYMEAAGESAQPAAVPSGSSAGDAPPSAENSALPAAPRTSVDLNGLRQYYAALSRAAVRFRTYPFQARRAGWEGQVALRLTIAETGTPIGQEVIGSSGYPVLDRAAIEMWTLAASHTPLPDSLRGRSFTIDLFAKFNLTDDF